MSLPRLLPLLVALGVCVLLSPSLTAQEEEAPSEVTDGGEVDGTPTSTKPDFGAGEEYDTEMNRFYRLLREEEYDRAIAVAQKAARIAEFRVGTDHDDYADAMVAIATVYHEQDRTESALAYYELAVSIREKVHGPNSPQYAEDLSNLAAVQREAGQAQTAMETMRRAMSLMVEPEKAENGLWAVQLQNMGSMQLDERDFEAAAQTFRRAISWWDKLASEQTNGLTSEQDRWGYCRSLHGLSVALTHADAGTTDTLALDEALPLSRKSLAIGIELYGAHEHALAEQYQQLGRVHRLRREFEQAETNWNMEHEINVAKHGFDSPLTARGLWRLGDLYLEQARYADAETYFNEAQAAYGERPERDPIGYTRVRTGLEKVYQATGRENLLEDLRWETMRVLERVATQEP